MAPNATVKYRLYSMSTSVPLPLCKSTNSQISEPCLLKFWHEEGRELVSH